MTNNKTGKDKKSETEKTDQLIFRCKFCGELKQFEEIRVLTRFSPPVVACHDCAKKMR